MSGQQQPLVRTSLAGVHERLGATMAPFAGWAMPLDYHGTLAEHEAVRTEAGVFDVSHLGTVWVTGQGAAATVAATFTNDPAQLADGESQYTLCCAEDGGILDDLLVYRIVAERFLAVPNAANTATVAAALEESASERGANVDDASRATAMLAVQGPQSLQRVGELFPDAVGRVGHHEIVELTPDTLHRTAGDRGATSPGGESFVPTAGGWLSRTGYTGEPGVEILLPETIAPEVFRQLVEDLAVTPAGLGARDTLRLEVGYPLHGNDLTARTDPFQARLSWAVKLDRGAFRGQQALRDAHDRQPVRRLWGIRAVDRGIPRAGMSVHEGPVDGDREETPTDRDTGGTDTDAAQTTVGRVTSGNFSPTLRTGIGLAYLDAGVGPGDTVTVDVRGKDLRFQVVKPPFIDIES